jgi:hypothetical protein
MIEKMDFRKLDMSGDSPVLADKLNELIDLVKAMNSEEKKEEWPKAGDEYWCVWNDGEVNNLHWLGFPLEGGRRNFMGIFHTREEAESRRDAIKKFISTLND